MRFFRFFFSFVHCVSVAVVSNEGWLLFPSLLKVPWNSIRNNVCSSAEQQECGTVGMSRVVYSSSTTDCAVFPSGLARLAPLNVAIAPSLYALFGMNVKLPASLSTDAATFYQLPTHILIWTGLSQTMGSVSCAFVNTTTMTSFAMDTSTEPECFVPKYVWCACPYTAATWILPPNNNSPTFETGTSLSPSISPTFETGMSSNHPSNTPTSHSPSFETGTYLSPSISPTFVPTTFGNQSISPTTTTTFVPTTIGNGTSSPTTTTPFVPTTFGNGTSSPTTITTFVPTTIGNQSISPTTTTFVPTTIGNGTSSPTTATFVPTNFGNQSISPTTTTFVPTNFGNQSISPTTTTFVPTTIVNGTSSPTTITTFVPTTVGNGTGSPTTTTTFVPTNFGNQSNSPTTTTFVPTNFGNQSNSPTTTTFVPTNFGNQSNSPTTNGGSMTLSPTTSGTNHTSTPSTAPTTPTATISANPYMLTSSDQSAMQQLVQLSPTWSYCQQPLVDPCTYCSDSPLYGTYQYFGCMNASTLTGGGGTRRFLQSTTTVYMGIIRMRNLGMVGPIPVDVLSKFQYLVELDLTSDPSMDHVNEFTTQTTCLTIPRCLQVGVICRLPMNMTICPVGETSPSLSLKQSLAIGFGTTASIILLIGVMVMYCTRRRFQTRRASSSSSKMLEKTSSEQQQVRRFSRSSTASSKSMYNIEEQHHIPTRTFSYTVTDPNGVPLANAKEYLEEDEGGISSDSFKHLDDKRPSYANGLPGMRKRLASIHTPDTNVYQVINPTDDSIGSTAIKEESSSKPTISGRVTSAIRRSSSFVGGKSSPTATEVVEPKPPSILRKTSSIRANPTTGGGTTSIRVVDEDLVGSKMIINSSDPITSTNSDEPLEEKSEVPLGLTLSSIPEPTEEQNHHGTRKEVAPSLSDENEQPLPSSYDMKSKPSQGTMRSSATVTGNEAEKVAARNDTEKVGARNEAEKVAEVVPFVHHDRNEDDESDSIL